MCGRFIGCGAAARLTLFRFEVDPGEVVAGGGQHFFEEVGETQGDARGVDAGVASVDVDVAQVGVDDQPDASALVVDESHRGDGSGMDVEIFLHLLGGGEGEARASELGGEIFCLEGLVGRNHQQIEVGLLPVGEEKVFEHRGTDVAAHGLAFLHGEGRAVAERDILDAEPVEEVIDSGFGRGAQVVPLRRASFISCGLEISIHIVKIRGAPLPQARPSF